jgi:16S rRNA (guanine966-N2)-methyltransferase
LRIISGKYKGRHIHPPANLRARPTTDFARESLFNILNNHLDFEGLRVLDLFAGTGSIGFEFSSRGAASVEMIENNFTHADFIKRTAGLLGATNIKVIRIDVFRFLPRISSKYDVVFADPPYDLDNFQEVPVLVLEQDILGEDGWFILEHSKRNDFSRLDGFYDHRKYGSVNFSFFRT